MTDAGKTRKLDELDRLLNDPDVPMEPAKVWSLLAGMAITRSGRCVPTTVATEAISLVAAIRNSRLPSGPVIGLSMAPRTPQPGSVDHQTWIRSQTAW